ncbi:MAG: 30S ribosomal protein S2 [Candidatus Diapherotrites archaeon]|uniref:Small ribosomal subunit protein uS2 n=1 Tax=Candidatus Iainarchaeum sp. TaxID=3101447 RepID=A0A2D6M0M0_9ARCH|nr:30S ribosomal protein S2 [Candidatus Diapherotrites archaeon]|tara:strand:- start:9345 stop:10031 length:687 start_codon:yes stop_codon:yes gene_type:complete
MAENTLVPLDKYLKTGAHIGTKFKTGDMKRYIFKKRKDGLNVLDVENIDVKIRIAAEFISGFDLERAIIVSRRAYGQKPTKEFAKAIGARAILGRFVPGTFTNPLGKEFIEPSIVIVADPEVDNQAVKEAIKVKAPVVALASTNNYLRDIDLIIPINNKGRKSLALVYWLLAREILKKNGSIKTDEEFDDKLADFEYELKEGGEEGEDSRKERPRRDNKRSYDKKDSR